MNSSRRSSGEKTSWFYSGLDCSSARVLSERRRRSQSSPDHVHLVSEPSHDRISCLKNRIIKRSSNFNNDSRLTLLKLAVAVDADLKSGSLKRATWCGVVGLREREKEKTAMTRWNGGGELCNEGEARHD